MNRLDARARLVFHYAREEADRLGHAVIESEHLLLGLLREGGIAAQVLNTCGLTLEAARFRVVELIGRFERSRDAPPPAITALARRVMDLAGVEASRYQSSLITTGHVLLGMIHAGDGVAMDIINQVKGGTKAVRRLTLTTLNLPPDEAGDIENSGLSGIVAVPADSVLGRLFQSKPDAVVPSAPPAVVIAPESQVVASVPNQMTAPTPEPQAVILPPERPIQEVASTNPEQPREPIQEFKLAFAEPVPVLSTPPEPVQIVVATPEPSISAEVDNPVPAPEFTQSALEAPELEQPSVAFTAIPDSSADEFVRREPMVSKHPTPVIEAPVVPFIEKTPTLDLDIIPEFVEPEPIPEPVPVYTPTPEYNPIQALTPEPVANLGSESVEDEEDFPETLLIDEAFVEVPPESSEVLSPSEIEYQGTTNEDQDLIPIELDDAIAESAPLPQVLGLPDVQESVSLPQLEAPELEQTQHKEQIVQNLVDTELAIVSPEPQLISNAPESEPVLSKEILEPVSNVPMSELVSSQPISEPIFGESGSEPALSEAVSELALGELEPNSSNQDLENIQATFSELELGQPSQHNIIQIPEPNFAQPLETESDLIASVAEFEAISNEAAEILPALEPEEISPALKPEEISPALKPEEVSLAPEPEILLDLTKELDLSSNTVLKTASWDMVTAASVTKRQIIALGGGGFSQEPDNLLLDNYILEHARSAREVTVPRVCFVSTAAGDSQVYIDRFYTAFNTLECEPYHLPLFKPEDWHDELEDMILGADVLYFSGGSTKNALALWKAWELEPVFRQAYEAGTVFAGVSAGAICWFEQFTTDSLGRSLGAMEGLGWLPGSFTPHYDAERYRKTILERLLRSRKIAPGFAADDGVAVHFINSEYAGAVSSRPDAKAYHVTLGRNRLVESPLETRYLG